MMKHVLSNSRLLSRSMAPCTATNCKKHEEELLANQVEQSRLLSQVVIRAAKVATAYINLIKGILESCGGEGEALPA